jgi:hypothetical protein
MDNSTLYTDLKAFFNFSWSIFIARAETVFGILLAAASMIDWSPILSGVQTGLTWTQGVTIGSILFVKGIVSEIGRRRGTVTLSDGQMIPAQINQRAEAIEIIEKAPVQEPPPPMAA